MASALSGTALALYKACLEAPNCTLSQPDLLQSVQIKDQSDLLSSLNTLLKKKLFTLLKDAKGSISYKAVRKAEAKIKGDMDGDEGLVYSHIEGSGNEGIWTKTLKGRTNLHQTVLNRCLKTLEQKMLIKSIKSVKFPTRKIYMLAHLTPSAEISGGPWYTDHEFDTEFIKTVMRACLSFIQERSFPRATPNCSQPVYSTSYTNKYPNAQQITTWMRKTRIADTDLSVEHVQMLLDVLVYDGEVEALPSISLGSFEVGSGTEEDSDDSENDKKRKKKKGKVKEKKGKGKKKVDSDEDEDEDDARSSKRKKKKATKDDGSDDDSEDHRSSSKRKKRKRDDDTLSEGDSDDDQKRKSKKKRKKSRRSDTESSSDSGDSDSDEDSDVSDDSDDRKSKKKNKKKSTSSKKRSRAASPVFQIDLGGSVVYRAVRQEKIGLGWSQAPWGRCPQFEFCDDKGPVNAAGCHYYENWLGQEFGVE